MNGQDIDQEVYNKRYKFLLVSAVSAFIATLDASIVNVSLPTLAGEFSVPIDDVAWVVLSYSLVITASLLLVARIAVKYGYRLIYTLGFGLFTLGSILCALSPHIIFLILSRMVQGAGAAFLMSSGPALVTRTFPANERGKSMGIIGTVVGVGLMTGPPLGGLLVSTIGWPSIFLINIPVGIFGLFYSSRLLKLLEPDDAKTSVDYAGGVLQAVGIIMLLTFLNRINNPDWSNTLLAIFVIVAVVSFTAYLWRESSVEKPLLGLSIFKYKQFTIALCAMLITFTCSSSGMVLIPFYLERMLHLDPLHVGLVLVTIPICTMLAAPLAGRVSDAIGYWLLTTAGLVMFVTGIFWMATLKQDSSRFEVIIRLILVGVGMGIFQAPNSSALMTAVPRRIVGVASGLLAVARNMGITGGVALATALFTHYQNTNAASMPAGEAFMGAFSRVVEIFGFIAIAAILISVFRKNRISDREHQGV